MLALTASGCHLLHFGIFRPTIIMVFSLRHILADHCGVRGPLESSLRRVPSLFKVAPIPFVVKYVFLLSGHCPPDRIQIHPFVIAEAYCQFSDGSFVCSELPGPLRLPVTAATTRRWPTAPRWTSRVSQALPGPRRPSSHRGARPASSWHRGRRRTRTNSKRCK